jgi:hypothetical protein
MPNTIPTDQNKAESIEVLRASRQVYDQAKMIGTIQRVLAVSSALIGPVVSAFWPAARVWAGLYGAIALLIDVIFLEPSAKMKQATGAKIQEQFDTKIYDLPWNCAKVGRPPDPETVVNLAAKHQKKHPDLKTLVDWYPTAVGQLPIEYARLVCQRSNMRWDSALRRTFCSIFLIVLMAMWVVGSVYALAASYDMASFVLSVVVPLLPASVQLWREYKRQEESADDSERAKEYLERLWDRAINNSLPPSDLTQEARILQDELYDRRRRAPPIPRFLYKRTRHKYEEQMKRAAATMVNAVLEKTGLPPGSS